MASKKDRKKLKHKNEKVEYLFCGRRECEALHAYISWSAGFRSFEIINGKSFETITERSLIQNGKQCWFNLSNVKDEVKKYAKERNLSTTGLGELYKCIDDEGFSYSNKDPKFDEVKKKAESRSILLID